MQRYGPQKTQNYNYNDSLLKFMQSCDEYVARLAIFNKFIIWRYTIGSASVNYVLIFNKIGDNAPRWTYLFFKYHNNTFGGKQIDQDFKDFKWYFINPEAFNNLSLNEQIRISSTIINKYIKRLQNIILGAPKTTGKFHVFKVAPSYPGLPSRGSSLPVDVLQLPFNSTTINPYFNFAPFIASNADGNLFDITIPSGSVCLFIPQDYHAYNFELEIILPFGSKFHITNIRQSNFDYVDPKSVNTVTVQNVNKIIVGPVYEINEYVPCTNGCIIQEKPFTVYDTILLF